MKRLVSLVLLLVLATCANANQLINGSFENDLIGWEIFLPPRATIATVNSHSDPGGTGTTFWGPTDGIWFALMKTNGAGQEATLSQTFDAEEGGTLSFDYFWDSRDHKPFNDRAKGELLAGGVPVATLFMESIGSDPEDFWGTPWKHVSYTFTNAGVYTLRFSICNDIDSGVDSYLGIDNVNLEGCKLPPEPINPDPCDGAIDVPVDTNLSWGAPCSASCDLPNGGFENGIFSPWTTVTGSGEELTPWNVSSGGTGWFENGAPIEGTFFAQNGFDGSAGLFYDIYQEIAIPACATSAVLIWSERIQWDMYNYGPATQPREYVVSVQPAGGGASLAILHTRSLNPGTVGDTGYVSHSVDLLSVAPNIAGQTVRINFHEYIPEMFTGPAQFDLDAVSLSCNGSSTQLSSEDLSPPQQADTLDLAALQVEYDHIRADALAAYANRFAECKFGQDLGEVEDIEQTVTSVSSVPLDLPSSGQIINGDFETGDFSGWTLMNSGSGTFVINDGTHDPLSPDGPLPPYSGNFSALSDQGGPGIYLIYQDVTLPPDATSATLYWVDMIRNHAGIFEDPDQEFRVEIWNMDNQVLSTLFSTNPGAPLFGDWTERSVGISQFAGMTIRIAFTVESQWFFFNVHLDDVWIKLDGGCPTTYDVYFGTDPCALELIPECNEICEPTCDPTPNPGEELDPDTKYYWYVVAKNRCGDTNSPPWSFTTVVINQDPNCSDAVPSIAELWAPEHKWVDIEILGVTDPDGDQVSITITGITQDEPVAGEGSGKTCPDGDGVGTSVAHIRAERSGLGNGRVYEISFEADDGRGGVCSGTVNVCAPHDQGQGQGYECIDDGQLYDSTAPELLRADLNDDGVINQLDFAILANHWLTSYELDD